MGDMGAEVVKVETHTRGRGGGGGGTFADNIPPTDNHWNREGSFHALHRSKLGITLYYKVPETVEAPKAISSVSTIVTSLPLVITSVLKSLPA